MTPITLVEIGRPARAPVRVVELTIDGRPVSVPEGTTILSACATIGVTIPTLCFLETLKPVNVCRLCVVELEGARVLAPSCSRAVEPGMLVQTRSPRVMHARKLVLELLASSVDVSTTPGMPALLEEYGCRPERFGTAADHAAQAAEHAEHAAQAAEHAARAAEHAEPAARAAEHAEPAAQAAEHAEHAAQAAEHAARAAEHAEHAERPATVAQPVKIDNDLYIRDYAKCVLCYKCVEACGVDHQNTFAIAVAGRGFGAHISTEFTVALPDSACVYCGNCIAVCPTGALMTSREYELRKNGAWDESRHVTTNTICPYCGVGCTLTLHVQDGEIVKATSPLDNTITAGNLCIKGRFGWRFVE
jgi:predicted molibdopterin-dependent oxidoreductase YjgC